LAFSTKTKIIILNLETEKTVELEH